MMTFLPPNLPIKTPAKKEKMAMARVPMDESRDILPAPMPTLFMMSPASAAKVWVPA